MNKLLIGLGLVALAVVGSVGVWKLADTDRRAGALEDTREAPSGAINWRGAYDPASEYKAMDAVSFKGSSYIAASTAGPEQSPPDKPWDLLAAAGAQGSQGAAGTFTGTFQSPDGKYKLSVTNAGIEADGPGGRVKIDGVGVNVRSAATLVLDAGSTLDLKAAANATLRGSMTLLGCASGGGSPVTRVGDQQNLQAVAPYQGGNVTFTARALSHGSTTVLAC